jgi:hypothetical protein
MDQAILAVCIAMGNAFTAHRCTFVTQSQATVANRLVLHHVVFSAKCNDGIFCLVVIMG